MRAARRKGAHLVNWVQDVYPEIAIELGVPLLKGPVASSIGYWRDRSLKSAALNVVVGQIMAAKLAELGVAPNRIKIIDNWADDREISPVSHADNRLRRLWCSIGNSSSAIPVISGVPTNSLYHPCRERGAAQ